MENKILLEEIKRMHQIIGISPDILINEENSVDEAAIPGTSRFAQILAKVLVSDVVDYGGKSFTRKEVRTIMNKVGSKALANDEKAVVRIATSRVIAKDASKSILKTIAATFAADMKSITDDAVASATFKEFKNDFSEILSKENATALENEIKDQVGKIKRGIKPADLNVKGLIEIAKTLDVSKGKNYKKITDNVIATYRAENPTLGTTDLVRKIISDCPESAWTVENVRKVAGPIFNDSTKAIAQFLNWVKGGAKDVPVGKSALVILSGIAVYVAGNVGVGVARKYDLAFQTEMDKIKKKYPCLLDSDGLPKWIRPEKNYYVLMYQDGSKAYAVWNEDADALYYVANVNNLENKGEMVSCN
jgi:hypothetical protein